MKLLLTSAGITNRSINKALEELVGKPTPAIRVAVIPTAANVEPSGRDWLIDDIVSLQKWAVASLDVIELASVGMNFWGPVLEAADVFYLSGRNDLYLMYWLEKSGLKSYLTQLLHHKVYVGSSAGSVVMGKKTELEAAAKLDEDLPDDEVKQYLEYVDFAVRTHMNSPLFPEVAEENLSALASKVPHRFYALDDNSAVKVVDNEVMVVSEGRWASFND